MANEKFPPGVTAADVKYPTSYGDVDSSLGDYGKITFHRVEGKQGSYWAIATLPISKSRNGYADRTYAVTLTGGVVTIGKGPHVKETFSVWIRKSRLSVLQKYVDLHTAGKGDAGQIRDRIGSRRAQGQLRRAEGRTSWRWDS